jgi:predicted glycosyltransferase
VHVITSVGDSLAMLGAADLVVAMAGYNTTAEILSLGKRALLVPRAGPSAEQRIRASLFAERGWIGWLPPEALSATALAEAMLEQMSGTGHPHAVGPDMGGRAAAVRQLLLPTADTVGHGENTSVIAQADPSLATPAPGAAPVSSSQQLVIGS